MSLSVSYPSTVTSIMSFKKDSCHMTILRVIKVNVYVFQSHFWKSNGNSSGMFLGNLCLFDLGCCGLFSCTKRHCAIVHIFICHHFVEDTHTAKPSFEVIATQSLTEEKWLDFAKYDGRMNLTRNRPPNDIL